jgi:predicted nuclease of predicted toxin-antitoxin system
MKLLFDQNLPRTVVGRLSGLFPGSVHVSELGLADSDDEVLWVRAGGWVCARFEGL